MQISVEYRWMMAPTKVRWVDIGVQYSQSQCGAVWFRVVQWSVLKATATRTAARATLRAISEPKDQRAPLSPSQAPKQDTLCAGYFLKNKLFDTQRILPASQVAMVL